jgi:site-specific DNA-methyltransferase (adenine-specific)
MNENVINKLNLCNYEYKQIGDSLMLNADCMSVMQSLSDETIHGIVTDPPYGFKEFELEQIKKLEEGKGGIWRLPPAFDGSVRSPVPRFTALTPKERNDIREFFLGWGKEALRIMRPGGHLVIATNAHISPILYNALIESGWEFRTEIIRTIETLRGGDRPKNAEEEFPEVTVLPKGKFEPWGLFRKPLPKKMTVAECLRTYQTGGLRRISSDRPFGDLIFSEKTPKAEKQLSSHPNMKPQSLMRQLVHAVLPLGEGIIFEPFSGSGSTVAAAEAMGYSAIGVERYKPFYEESLKTIEPLSKLKVDIDGYGATGKEELQQISFNL